MRFTCRTVALTALLGCTLASGAGRDDAPAKLTIRVAGPLITHGPVMIALFGSEAAYRAGTAPLRAIQLDPSDPHLVVQLELTPGRYAIKAFHDLNGNGKLDQNLFGAPSEPVAFSNHARVHLGPPGWDEASFEIAAGDNVQTLQWP